MHIKNIFKLAGIISALQFSNFAQADTTYDYSYLFDGGHIVSGSFTGIANGNLITNLSNITANLDGTPFDTDASGSLYGFSYVADIDENFAVFNTDGALGGKTTWINGTAVASFNGTENNFLFIDSSHPDSASFSNLFAIGNSVGNYKSIVNASGVLVDQPFDPAHWTVAEEVVATPIPAAAWLFAPVLLGWLGVNPKKRQH